MDITSDLKESNGDLSDTDYDKMLQKSKEKAKYSANTCFTALSPPTATFPMTLPLQDVSCNQHFHQGYKIYSVPVTQEEQVRDVKDLQASAKNKDRTEDDPTMLKYTLETTDSGLQQYGSSMPNSPTLNDNSQKTLDNITTRYCLATKVQVRRYPQILTSNVAKHADISFLSSFKSLHTDNTIFRILYYTKPAPTRLSGVPLVIHNVHAYTAECTFIATGHSCERLYIDNSYSRKATPEEIPDTGAEESSYYQLAELLRKDEALCLDAFDNLITLLLNILTQPSPHLKLCTSSHSISLITLPQEVPAMTT